jgi:hypothetical protein
MNKRPVNPTIEQNRREQNAQFYMTHSDYQLMAQMCHAGASHLFYFHAEVPSVYTSAEGV